MKPYFADDRVELYLGDMRGILPALGVRAAAARRLSELDLFGSVA